MTGGIGEKPIIRHCRNCKWSIKYACCSPECTVKYEFCFNPRLKALFCRYYKQKEVKSETTEKTNI